MQSIFNQAIYRLDEKKILNMSPETSGASEKKPKKKESLIRSIDMTRDDIINKARGAYFVITDNLSFK